MHFSVRLAGMIVTAAAAALALVSVPAPAVAAGCPGSLSDGQSCTVASIDLGYVTGPVALNAAVVVDDSGTGVDSTTYRSYLTATIFCRRGSTVIFSTGAIRNVWKGATAGVYPRGLLIVGQPSTTRITCTLEAKQAHLENRSPRTYPVAPTPYIFPTNGGSGVSSPGPNRDFAGNWGTTPNVETRWPAGTAKGQVVRQQWSSGTSGGTVQVVSSTNLTSCHYGTDVADHVCSSADVPPGGESAAPATVTVNLWAWQTVSGTDLSTCGTAAHEYLTVKITPQIHHLTVPLTKTWTKNTACSSTIVLKTEIGVSGAGVYTSSWNTSIGAYHA